MWVNLTEMIFCTCAENQHKTRVSLVLVENSVKMMIINSILLPRSGQLAQRILSGWNTMPYRRN